MCVLHLENWGAMDPTKPEMNERDTRGKTGWSCLSNRFPPLSPACASSFLESGLLANSRFRFVFFTTSRLKRGDLTCCLSGLVKKSSDGYFAPGVMLAAFQAKSWYGRPGNAMSHLMKLHLR